MASKCIEKISGKEKEVCLLDLCTGCGACKNICPQNCIEFRTNQIGIEYAVINTESCIHCHLCKKVCPNINTPKFSVVDKCYAGWRSNKQKRIDSSSGGIATVISERIVQQGDVVFGVNFEEKKGSFYACGNTLDDIERFKGSKYVQAEMGTVFSEVEKELLKEKKVVFVGLPCQVAALSLYFDVNKQKRELSKKLYTIDFLCHGSLPNKYLLEELHYLKTKKNIRYDDISFRGNDSKKNYYLCLYKDKKLVYRKKAEDQYYFYSFLNSIATKESCLHCPYKQKERVGDITLGDFIGLGKKLDFKEDSNEKGNPSLILVNTDKGKELIELCGEEIKLWERPLEEAIEGGPSLRGGTQIDFALREKFKREYIKSGFHMASKKTFGFKMKQQYIKICYDNFLRNIKYKIKTLIMKV